MTTFSPPSAPARERRSASRRVVVASTLGTAIEWYDFYLYSTASALVLGPLFFPGRSDTATMLAAFATYAAGFVARPLGGILFGHFGDRYGRKSMLVITLLVMGGSTLLVGALPTYEQAGLTAPVLLVLLRVLQGIGIGGEWGGGALMAAEHAPPHRRGLYTAFPAAGFPIGLFASTGVFALVSRLPEDDFLSWGWRLPFLASFALVAVGLFVRLGVRESPVFVAERHAGRLTNAPLRDVLRGQPGRVVRGALAALGLAMVVSTFSVYFLSWAAETSGRRDVVLTGLLVGALAEAVLLPVFGALSDRWGRKPVMLLGYTVSAAVALPAPYWLGSSHASWTVIAYVLAMGIGHAAVYGGFSAFLIDLFPTRHRYSAIAVTYQLGATVASFGPLLATALAGASPTPSPMVLILLCCLALGALAVATAPVGSPRSAVTRQTDRAFER
ncbi:MFS transporter [Streptomyces sp. NPDC060053]|uniref:MFS transporter n=1 Tax=Streptomyces sp. NPDC060053 TaxID=3347047 RepID=UPI00369B92F7